MELFNGLILPDGNRVKFSKAIDSRLAVADITIRNHPAYNRQGDAKQLVTTAPIPNDTHIGSYGGQICNGGDSWNPYMITPKDCDHDIDGNEIGNEMRYINDAKGVGKREPNVGFFLSWKKLRGYHTVEVRTLRDIASGEEILASYGEGYWDGLKIWYEEQNPYICPHCDYRTNEKKVLTSHIWNHNRIREPRECEYCGEEFADTWAYYTHANIHTKDVVYACDQCEYKGPCRSSLYGHQNRKHLKRTWECPQCGILETSCFGLKIHVAREHTKEFLFHCDECNYGCFQTDQLKNHKISKHGAGELLKCPYADCDYETPRNWDLKKHVETTHSTGKIFHCSHDDCDFESAHKSSLKIHVKAIHDKTAKRVQCDQCSYDTVYPGNLQAHKKRKH